MKYNLLKYLLICGVIAGSLTESFAQTGTLAGIVSNIEDKEDVLMGAYVRIVGTYDVAITKEDGRFAIGKIKPGDYTIKVSYIGFADYIQHGVQIKPNQITKLSFKMTPQTSTFKTVTVNGKKNLVDLDNAESRINIKSQDIQNMNVRDVQEVVALQAGVSKTMDGIQIRGARVYETQYIVDGISAQDPLAGTGFGLDVSASSIGEIDLITGGSGAEFGDGSSGVIVTTIKEGGEKFEIAGAYQKDIKSLGGWNTDLGELSFGGPIGKKFNYFNNLTFRWTDEYFGPVADQLHSSLFGQNDSFWAPRQTNNYTHTLKLAYKLKSGTKITFTNQHSLNINQNTRSLQIVGFDAILTPGFQFSRSLNLDNATTYTHRSNLSSVNIKHVINEKNILDLAFGRLFTNLRADANGKPFRTSTIDRIYDENSIVTDPVGIFNPDDEIQYVLPGPGLINNGGITPIWHDHFAREITIKAKIKHYPKKEAHKMEFGWEHKINQYQWVDVSKPWIGAPIQIDDTTFTPSISIGASNDIWKVKPMNGGLFFQDKIQYEGIIATLGMRFNYWAPGQFADNAVDNPKAPVIDQVREDYKNKTLPLGLRFKARILPKVNVSFPVTTNKVLYFNYGHSMRLPHPRFLYAGLDPAYQDRSFLSFLGNPDINPEINVSYEVGLKSQLSKDFGFTVAAFNNNRFDYIVSRKVFVKDVIGRPVTKTMYINQDYAKIQGVETNFQYRINQTFSSFLNISYQTARGKSNSARESSLQIQQNGEVPLSTEQYLAWDRPWNINLGLTFIPDTNHHLVKWLLKDSRWFVRSSFQSGFRYTPQILEDSNDLGRPLYRSQIEKYLEERAKPWFMLDISYQKTVYLGNQKKKGITLSAEARNVLNFLNPQIINPITGDAFKEGDDVPTGWRDERYLGPEENGTPPNNPARFQPPRQVLVGLKFRF